MMTREKGEFGFFTISIYMNMETIEVQKERKKQP